MSLLKVTEKCKEGMSLKRERLRERKNTLTSPMREDDQSYEEQGEQLRSLEVPKIMKVAAEGFLFEGCPYLK